MTMLGEIGLAGARETFSGGISDSRCQAIARATMIVRSPSSPRPTKRFSNSCANLRKPPIGFRQILGAGDRDRVACLEGAGIGGLPLAGDTWMISMRIVLVDAVCDLLPGLLLSVFLD
jgi:hypothetical protein